MIKFANSGTGDIYIHLICCSMANCVDYDLTTPPEVLCQLCQHSFLEHSVKYIGSHNVVVVALLFYVHGKHLRSCRDGQLT